MTNSRVAERTTSGNRARPKVVGFVRGEVSGLDAPRHAVAVARHARLMGYEYVYTVRPPRDSADPVGFALGIAAGLDVAAIVVFDLAHVDDRPALVCEDFDLETVCPPVTWARVAARSIPLPPRDASDVADPRPAAGTLREVLDGLSEPTTSPEPLQG
ncbi:hypothetical protein OHA40_22635 [Nocardia sp. NBC_00508]|uniref:hypothetical protein n=1 Tax=Nocardia sp. NBC_00508 TaxID=2975992 RepID=UPI002E805300|nr:hypothetical protein [Nocardia sp. NBC_00508]WUD64476.1 hypothetical protein OHA40_22635 [Nocardia sp. NBC_00508]